MNPQKFQEQILNNAVQMDASVNFQLIEVDADGRTRVKRYNDGSKGPLHETLYETAHGAVKMTRPQIRPYNGRRRMDEEFVYVTFKFPKKYGLARTKALYEEEADEIMSYYGNDFGAIDSTQHTSDQGADKGIHQGMPAPRLRCADSVTSTETDGRTHQFN